MSEPLFFPCPFEIPCDVYGCSKKASWYVGRPDGPLSLTLKLCDDCARAVAASIPAELLPKPEKEAPRPGPEAAGETEEAGDTLKCPECGKEYRTGEALRKHFQKEHMKT